MMKNYLLLIVSILIFNHALSQENPGDDPGGGYVPPVYNVTLEGPSVINLPGPSSATIQYQVIWSTPNVSPVNAPAGGNHFWNTSGSLITQSSDAQTISVVFTGPGTADICFTYYTASNYYLACKSVTVNPFIPTPPEVPVPIFSFRYDCGVTVISRNATSPSQGINWVWQTAPLGTSNELGFGNQISRSNNQNLYLRAFDTATGLWSLTSAPVPAFTIVNSTPVPSTPYHKDLIFTESASVELSASSVPGATQYRWYTSATNPTPIHSSASTPFQTTVYNTTDFFVEAITGNCPSISRLKVTATKWPHPLLNVTNNGNIVYNQPVTLSVQNPIYDSYQWIRANGESISGANGSSFVTNEAGSYRVKVTKGNSGTHTSLQSIQLNVLLPPAVPVTSFSISNACGSTTILRNSTFTSDVIRWYWQTEPLGTSQALGFSAQIVRNTNSSLYLRAYDMGTGLWSTTSLTVPTFTIIYNPPTPSTSHNKDVIFSQSALVELSVDPVQGADQYRWYTAASGTSPIFSSSGVSYQTTVYNTTDFFVEAVNAGCPSPARLKVTVTQWPTPNVSATANGIIAYNQPVMLSVQNPVYDSYQWIKSTGEPINGANSTNFSTSEPGSYTVLVTKGNSPVYQSPQNIELKDGFSWQNVNYIKETEIIAPGIYTLTFANTTQQNARETISYYDGFGRVVQDIGIRQSRQGKDLIQPVYYNQHGLEELKVLPFTANSETGFYRSDISNASVITNPNSPLLNFYNNPSSSVAVDSKPFSNVVFESTYLQRPLKQGAPGLAWQPNGDHTYNAADRTVKFSYEFNQANEVRLWKYAYPSAANPLGIVTGTATNTHYGANQLYKNKTKDEQQNEVIEYVDKEGKTILKRVQVVSGNAAVNDTNYASTYYVYDDFGNLVSVIQPEGTKLLTSIFKPFTWGSVSGFTVSADNTLTKTNPTGYTNSGAYLSSGISSSTNGWVRMVALETNTSRMIGLTPANAGNNNNIAFALELGNDGFIYVWEDGIKKNNLGSYTSGTSVMVSREGGYIKYYVNEIEKLISEKTTATSLSTSVLYLDVTINEQGGTIQNVDISFSSEKMILKNYSFQYAYDARKRMIMKQVPGAEPVYLVYDNRDRLVMTQDAKQRSSTGRPWTFTKYDALNRPIATGLKDTTVGVLLTQAQMQALVDNFYTKASSRFYEDFVGTAAGNLHGYSNKSFPTTQSAYGATVGSPNENYFLTVTYYDDYSAITNWGSDYQYSDLNLQATANGINYPQPDSPNNRVKGQVTATKVKVLDGGITGGPTWLKSINYYDDKYRVIQNISDNYKGGVDKLTNLIDFSGKVLLTNTEHITRDIAWQDISNLELIGNKILSSPTKVNAWGNAGAASTEQLPAGQNGWIEFTVFQGWGNIVLGLSDQNVDNYHNTIDYGIYFGGGSVVRPYENGVAKSYPPYGIKAGDILKIERIGTQIRYYQNGILLYTSTIPSTTSLVADIAIFDKNLAVSNVRTSFSQKTNTIKRRFDYDHAGRLINTWHSFNNQPEVLLAHNEYNELGQLIDKKLHVSSPVGGGQEVAKQSVDYAYNIRGWLTNINDATLTPQAGESKDYFGMELAYNTDLGTGNPSDKLQFNGNINAMKWSNNQGLGDQKENAYNFTYDPLNRLKTADFRQKDISSWGLAKHRAVNGTIQSVDAFKEHISSYDLNGNIMQLQRSGQDGSLIDNLAYNYGANSTTQSNKLLRVTDAAMDQEGFKEIDSFTDDYTYDNNGNLIYDRNKLSDEILANESFEQGSANWTLTEPARMNFSNGRVTFTAGSNPAVLNQSVQVKDFYFYVANINLVRTSLTGSVNIVVGGSLQTYTVTTSTSLVIPSRDTDAVIITATPDFAGYIESISVHGTTAITYNYLNLPETVNRGDQGQIRYIYTATGQKLAQVVTEGTKTKTTDYVGEYVYENDTLLFVNHEEGRLSLSFGEGQGEAGGEAQAEYQYHLKDHLGNVRLTFTTKEETEATLATLETTNENEERGNFLKYDDIRKVNSRLFDHTHAPGVGSTHYAMRLSGTPQETYGLARSIAVMPGDVISAEVFAKYVDLNDPNVETFLENLAASIAAGTTSPGVVIDGGNFGTPAALTMPFGTILNKSSEAAGTPKAYLNWIVFDKNFRAILSKSGYRRVTTAASENGSLDPTNGLAAEGFPHERLFTPTIEVTEPGYVYIYLSNEEAGTEVYFDDFKVTHTKSPVIQSDDYYPFGMTFNSYKRESSLENKIRFQGQEHIDDLDLGWDSFKWRNHMPDIGRFFNVDPLADKYVYNSPYAFSENHVVAHRELEGLEKYDIKQDVIPYADPENYSPGNNIVPKGTYVEKRTTNTSTVTKYDGKSNNPEVSIRRDYDVEGGQKLPSQITTTDSKGNTISVSISFLNTGSDNKNSNNAVNKTAAEGFTATIKKANEMDAGITSIAVSATTNGNHSGGWKDGDSNHYNGSAVDIGLINGHAPGVGDSTIQKAADKQSDINENFGPHFDHKGGANTSDQKHNSWIHLSFKKKQ